MKLLLLTIFISSIAYGQKDSSEIRKQQANRNDSLLINAVVNDMKSTLYGKVQPQYYDALNEMIKEYIKQKSLQWQSKPK